MVKTVLRVGAIVVAIALRYWDRVYAQGVVQNEISGNECWNADKAQVALRTSLHQTQVRNGRRSP